jgi:hypothetical protein
MYVQDVPLVLIKIEKKNKEKDNLFFSKAKLLEICIGRT